MEIIDEVFAQHVLAIAEKRLLLVASPFGHVVGPLLQSLHIAAIGFAHQIDELIKIRVTLVVDVDVS